MFKAYNLVFINLLYMSLFGDIFDTEEQILSGETGGNMLSHWQRMPKNCAHNLNMPDLARKKGYPIGLKNQGATCYLNSLFQILFHTPQFRQLMLSLPLCKNTVQQSTDFVEGKAKHSFLLGLQRLFSEMSSCDMRAVGTDYLNKSFGWQKNENKQQHDIQQAMRIIFDVIQRALFGTQYGEAIKSFFKGSTIRYKTCKNCGQSTQHMQNFYDIQLQVKNLLGIEQSLIALTTAESMDGDNQIYCELCQSKQDMWLGNRLNELPNTLIFSLNRFDFDYQKMDRVKLNSEFQFYLELDLSSFLLQSPQLTKSHYQLYGVLIHRGTAQGGHYKCYTRDILHQSNWNDGLKQTKQQQQKLKSQSSNKKEENSEDKKKDKTVQKTFTLRQSINKQLQLNWYQINDNVATAIDKEKIAKQFEGSQSAYILFYRRKGLTQKINLQIPKYFAQGILQSNRSLQKQRQQYQIEKTHIILNINNQNVKLNINMSIADFIQQFVQPGYVLVQQSTHNQLPYYPMHFINSQNNQSKAQSTLKSQEVVHQSIWRSYQLNCTYYETVKSMIGKNRLPMEIIILDGEAPKRIVCFSDENFLMLRVKLEKVLNVPYQFQIITLITPYKQSILTDKTQNDQVLLPKLGIIHSGQLLVKSLGNQNDSQKGQKVQQKLTLCFLVERDDVIGLKRIYFEKTKTLNELLIYCNLSQSTDLDIKRRFRNMGTNRLYYNSHYEKALQQLQFTEEMIKLRLQRGQIPIKGDVCIRIKLQSQLYRKNQAQSSNDNIQKIFDPNIVISDVKQWACTHYKIDPSLHKLYLTDWTGEPIRSLTREKQTLFQANFGREQLICLRDINSPIGTQLVHLQMFQTKTGSPDNLEKQSIHIKIEEFKTVQQLKQLLISTVPALANVSPQRLRLRQIKRDYMFGTIWRQTKKSVKSVTINSNKAVYQVLQSPEQLRDDQIVLILKKRNPQKRLYEGSTELIFDAGKSPTMQELHHAIKNKVKEQSDIKTIKYVNYDFQWVEVSRENIQKLIKKKKNNAKNQPKKDQPKKTQKTKRDYQKKDQFKKKDKSQIPIENTDSKQEAKTQVALKQQKPKEQKPKEAKPKRQPKEKAANNNANKPAQEHFNLRRAPILLKDGDWIGYGKLADLANDDLQTDQDLTFRLIKQQKGTIAYRRDQAGGFKINVDF